jgi:hypothetical protein
MLKKPTGMKRDTPWAKFTNIPHEVSPASLPDVSAGYCQRALVDEPVMIVTQMGTHNRSEVAAVLGTLCDRPPPLNSNSM